MLIRVLTGILTIALTGVLPGILTLTGVWPGILTKALKEGWFFPHFANTEMLTDGKGQLRVIYNRPGPYGAHRF